MFSSCFVVGGRGGRGGKGLGDNRLGEESGFSEFEYSYKFRKMMLRGRNGGKAQKNCLLRIWGEVSSFIFCVYNQNLNLHIAT